MPKEKMDNCIFYVSDFADLPSTGHFGKMDTDREIIRQLEQNLSGCKVMKYTEYDGSMIDAESVGIVFPSHTWGISLAVYSFLQSLRVTEYTYVYAVTMGASMSGDVDETVLTRAKTLQEFKRIFARRGMGDDSNVFVRCVDYKRPMETTEEKLRDTVSVKHRIENILEGLLFYNLETVLSKKLSSVQEAEKAHWKRLALDAVSNTRSEASGARSAASDTRNDLFGARSAASDTRDELFGARSDASDIRSTTTGMMGTGARMCTGTRPRMENVFLDESVWAGVRLCRVM